MSRPVPGHQIGHATVVTAILRDVDFTNGVAVSDAMTFPPPVPSPCVDLQAVYGSRFKIRKEADGATWGATPEAERVWLLELPCHYGVVYPHGGEILAAVVTSRIMGRRVAALPGILSSRGDIERIVTFAIDDADAVLELLRPSRRRQISPEERARLVAMGQRHSFAGAQVPKTRLESTQTSEASPEGQPALDVIVAAPDVVPSEGIGTRHSCPADTCDVPGADPLGTAPRWVSASHGRKARG